MKAILTILVALALSGCGTTLKDLSTEYPNYTVVGKDIKQQTTKVPRYVIYCVKPNGDIRCKREYGGTGAYSACAQNCRVQTNLYRYPDRQVKQQEGTKDSVYSIYFLKLQSPSGKEIIYETNHNLFQNVSKGQVLTPL